MSAQYKKCFEAAFLTNYPKGPKYTIKNCKVFKHEFSFVRRWSDHNGETGNEVACRLRRAKNYLTFKS